MVLDVYVRALPADKPEGGDLTSTCGRLTLVGVVDFMRRTKWTPEQAEQPLEKEQISYLPSEYRRAAPTAGAPAVWLVKDKWNDGERYLIPADPETGEPDFRYTKPGGHFAASRDVMFRQLVDSPLLGALPVRDLRARPMAHLRQDEGTDGNE